MIDEEGRWVVEYEFREQLGIIVSGRTYLPTDQAPVGKIWRLVQRTHQRQFRYSDSQDDNDKQIYDEVKCNSDMYIYNQLADHNLSF